VKRKKTGRIGEQIALFKLWLLGYRILHTNYRMREGEIDIIAQEGDTLVFVEVKTKRKDEYGAPEEAVDHRKRQKLSYLAHRYIAEKGLSHQPARFDVVAVDLSGFTPRVRIIRDAFDSTM
jgi:putative endonuclease